MTNTYLISVRPTWASAFFLSQNPKTIELRKGSFGTSLKPGDVIAIYATLPAGELLGIVRVLKRERLPIDRLWQASQQGKLAKVSQAQFNVGIAELGYDRLRVRLPKNNTSKNIELMQCPECLSSYVNKNGHKKGKQNYICVNCARQFIDCYQPHKGYSEEVKRECLKMYVNGLGFRAIERIKGVHHTTIINWVKQVGELQQSCL